MSAAVVDLRLSFRQALTLHLVACVLFVSGAAAAMYDILVAAGQDGTLPLSFKTWSLTVHGGAAMAFLVAFGAMLPTHVVRAWHSGRNRISGVILLTVIVLLTLSGYGLYYFGGERLRSVTQWVHLGLGIIEPFLVVLHIVLGRTTRRLDAEP